MKHWNKEDLNILTQGLSEGCSHKELSIRLNRTKGAVSKKIYELGETSQFRWNPENTNLLRSLIESGKNMTAAASQLNCRIESVHKKCKQLGITTSRGQILREQVELKKQGLKRCSDCKEIKPLMKEFFRRSNGYCLLCERAANSSHSYSSLGIVLTTRLRAAKTRALRKKVPFQLTAESLALLWEKQDGKCFYTGKAMGLGGKGTFTRVSPDGVSVDRISPERGYVEGNVVLCCWAVNYMKGDYSADEFKAWCKEVCDYA